MAAAMDSSSNDATAKLNVIDIADSSDDAEALQGKGRKRVAAPRGRGRDSTSTSKRGRKSDNSSSSLQLLTSDEDDDMAKKVNKSQPRKMDDQSKEQELVKIPNLQYPWLIISDSKKKERQMFYSVKEERWNPWFVPELQNKYISCCYRGWSVVIDYSTHKCTLLNLSTNEKVRLPPLVIPYHHICVLSSSPSTDDSCRVLFMCRGGSQLWSCYVGDTAFRKEERILDMGFSKAAINFQGKLNIMSYPNYNLLTTEFSNRRLRFSMVISGEILHTLTTTNADNKFYLVESSGELLLVYIDRLGHEIMDLNIFKADFTKGAWVWIKNLGDRTIFLDEHKGFSTPASRFGLKENCVYFVNAVDRSLYCFDLIDGCIAMSLPCPIVSVTSSLCWASLPCTDQDK